MRESNMEYIPGTKKEFDILVQVFSRAREYGIPAEEVIKAMEDYETKNKTTQNCPSQSSSPLKDSTYIEHG